MVQELFAGPRRALVAAGLAAVVAAAALAFQFGAVTSIWRAALAVALAATAVLALFVWPVSYTHLTLPTNSRV